ncbi:DEAD/DEAH box helicase [Saccharibacillus sp. VR-M41]|uniref:DEAD/DEAH box helicase n=2 Tax=Saccharibacillus alkalitolerans TaxID=2705290 RepID=A0ABX0F6S5_9BACL|nr:DEAD/DEAH box helicase [Saccharibacillus alkalitolerans]
MPLQWAIRLNGTQFGKEAADWSVAEWGRRLRRELGSVLVRENPQTMDSLLGIGSGVEGCTAGSTQPAGQKPQRGESGGESLAAAAQEAACPNRLTGQAERLASLMEGRSLLSGELCSMLKESAPELEPDWKAIVQLAYLRGVLFLRSAVEGSRNPGRQNSGGHRCARCGSQARGGPCGSCGSADCARCEACRALGRSRSCELLLQGRPQARSGRPRSRPLGESAGSGLPAVREANAGLRARLARWKLSAAQASAAEHALRFLETEPLSPAGAAAEKGGVRGTAAASGGQAGVPRSPKSGFKPDTAHYAASDPGSRFLLWAVTGAGKTEMLFPLIESVRSRGGSVLVATPRRDVVLELAPRLRKAFPDEAVVALYGGSEERWRRSGLTLATTHQLLRFAGAFDLVVIDELDAFPFHGDPMLAYAAEVCRASGGKTVYLSATPPAELQSLVRRNRLACAKVPVRYHRHPLPVPERLRAPSLAECLRRRSLPAPLLRRWRTSLERGAQIFIFVPKIVLAEALAVLLRRTFRGIPVGATSSEDEARGGKVLSFRSADLRILVTTTILERGVTVPRSDVYVLDADSGLFDEASLVQMAGRAGRSADDPAGRVVFAAAQNTKAQAGACRQIRRMNRLAKPFLLPETVGRGRLLQVGRLVEAVCGKGCLPFRKPEKKAASERDNREKRR